MVRPRWRAPVRALQDMAAAVSRRVGCPLEHLRPRRSQYDVAAELGVSRARVSQIEATALAKLRRGLEALGVDGPCIEPEPHWSEQGDADEEDGA